MSNALRLLPALRRLPARSLWVLVAALVLQAAVPLLAALSARAQGIVTAEVCSIYGVRTVTLDASGQPDGGPAQQESRAHDGGHCVLTPLLTAHLGAAPLAAVFLHAPVARRVAFPVGRLAPPDATQAWVAARKHGPPLSV